MSAESTIHHPKQENLRYPASRQQVVAENWHGVQVIDQYGWLEGTGPEIVEWEKAQNELTRKYLDGLGTRDGIRERLKRWYDLDQIGVPFPRDDKLFQWKRKGGENHFVLFVRDHDGAEKVVINPNILSADGTTAVDWTSLTNDGQIITYGVSEGGSENSTLKIRNVDTMEDLPDQIPFTRHCSVSWVPDKSGFFYTRYPEPGTVSPGDENYDRRVFFHKLGQEWRSDPQIFKVDDIHDDHPSITLSDDGKWAKLYITHGSRSNDIMVAKFEGNPEGLVFKPIASSEDSHFYVTEFEDNFYIMTDENAPRFKIMRVPCSASDLADRSKWEELIPENDGTLDNFQIVGSKLVLTYQVRANSELEIVDLKSLERTSVQLPTLGTVTSIGGEEDNPEMHYSFESFAFPDTIYKLNVQTGKQERVDGVKVDTDLSQVITDQVTYESKDGTPVTMFVIRKKDSPRDGNSKTILSGYGGFGVSETPAFSGRIVDWVNDGGTYVIANLRGGGEYGEDWHRAGMLDKKQNVFDDFISAAEHLIAEAYTQPERLAIVGGSNGGLLVGAALTQRPDLFGSVVCQVPLLDMIHYDRLKIAKFWVSEYGDPSNPSDFSFLYAYSPYHHVGEGIAYPSVLLTTAENDNRVDAMHARKMAARLQAATSSENPILLFVDDKAGHGQGKPVDKILDEQADIYTFLEATVGSNG